jgi:hypothetical protein
MRSRTEILEALNDGIGPFTEETVQQSRTLEAILEVLLDIRDMQAAFGEALKAKAAR